MQELTSYDLHHQNQHYIEHLPSQQSYLLLNSYATPTKPLAFQQQQQQQQQQQLLPQLNMFPECFNSNMKTEIQNYHEDSSNQFQNQCQSYETEEIRSNNKTGIKQKKKSSYKHIPHREKPVHLVARRNARERRRVQAVNSAFAKLRKCVPFENRNKRLSKVKTLHRAIEYIAALQDILREADEQDGVINDKEIIDTHGSYSNSNSNSCVKIEHDESVQNKYNKENQIEDQKWLLMDCNNTADPYINSGYNCNYRYLKCLP